MTRTAARLAAIGRVMKDPQLLADGEKSLRYVDFIDPQVDRPDAVAAEAGVGGADDRAEGILTDEIFVQG